MTAAPIPCPACRALGCSCDGIRHTCPNCGHTCTVHPGGTHASQEDQHIIEQRRALEEALNEAIDRSYEAGTRRELLSGPDFDELLDRVIAAADHGARRGPLHVPGSTGRLEELPPTVRLDPEWLDSPGQVEPYHELRSAPGWAGLAGIAGGFALVLALCWLVSELHWRSVR